MQNRKMNMESLIKTNLMKEETAQENIIKPTGLPEKRVGEISSILSQNSVKDGRVKAYSQMRKDNLNRLARTNPNNEALNKNYYDGNFVIDTGDIEQSISKRKDLSLLNQFEDFYKSKNLKEVTNPIENDNYKLEKECSNAKYTIINQYNIGANCLHQNSICFHKTEKWIGYLNRNLIIIDEEDIKDQEEDRPAIRQIVLSDSCFDLTSLKISDNGKILYAFSTVMYEGVKTLLFYSFNPDYEKRFSLINKCLIKHSKINDCEISPQNNMCIVLSCNSVTECYVSVLDFYHNEIILTTAMTVNYNILKWNIYLNNLEFSTLGKNLLTFWRINSSDVTLQYQHGDVKTEGRPDFLCMEYTPPLGRECVILLLIATSDNKIIGVDTKTNSQVIVYADMGHVNNIVCSLGQINLIMCNKIKTYRLNEISKIDDLNIFNEVTCHDDIVFDSDIISYDCDISTSNAIALTRKGYMYYINGADSLKLYNFMDQKSEMIQVKIIPKDYQKYSIRKIDYNRLHELTSEIRENHYFIVTGHKNGVIKCWSYPECTLAINFEVINEELLCLDTHETNIVASYSSGVLRFFDIINEKCIGKLVNKSIGINTPFKMTSFLPDGNYLFAIDMNNSIYLIKVEKYEPLLLNIHHILNLEGDILQFILNPFESYNKFLINLQDVYACVYIRKFTNILKNTTYDGNVPQFYMQDKFNPNEFLPKSQILLDEHFVYEFGNERNLLMVLSRARKTILVRNYELHTIENVINLNESPLSFKLNVTNGYFVTLYKNKIEFYERDACVLQSNLIMQGEVNHSDIALSSNGRLLIHFTKNSLFLYQIKISLD